MARCAATSRTRHCEQSDLADHRSDVKDCSKSASVCRSVSTRVHVDRVPDPDDGRARLVRITRRGYEVISIASGIQSKIEQEWTEHLDAQSSERLRKTLLRLREITDPFA